MLGSISINSIELSNSMIDINLLDMVLRLIVSCACGFLIGFERKTRSKEAGIRTHAIVCMAAALMMIVSKYGFADQIPGEGGVRGADSARIAAQVVSGIGFLGAGIIFYRRDMLHGLTTAAGIWVTAGIGLAIGAGMYVLGSICTVLLVLVQIILHRPFKIFRARMVTSLHMTVDLESVDIIAKIEAIFETKKILRFKTTTVDGNVTADIELVTPKTFTETEILKIVQENPYIKTLEKTEEM